MQPAKDSFTAHGIFGDYPLTETYFVEQKYPGYEMRQSSYMTGGGYSLSDDKLCAAGQKHVFQMYGIHPRTISNPVEYITGTPINDIVESLFLDKEKLME